MPFPLRRARTHTHTHTRACTYLDVLAETAGVVVADGPGIPEGLEDRVGLQHLLLDRAKLRRSRLAAEDGEVLHDDLACFGLSRAGLAAHQDGLLLTIQQTRTAVVVKGICLFVLLCSWHTQGDGDTRGLFRYNLLNINIVRESWGWRQNSR